MSAGAVRVRRLRPDDWAIYRDLRLEMLTLEPDAYASTLDTAQGLDPDNWRRRTETALVMCVFVAGEAVGLMGVLAEQGARVAHRGTLVMVYVRAEARGTGAAKALLDGTLAKAHRAGLDQVELLVAETNPRARAFYRREGFVEIGTLPRALRLPEGDVAEVFMVRSLP